MIEAIIEALLDIAEDIINSINKHTKGFKMTTKSINNTYTFIPIFNKKILLQNQRRY